MEKRIFTAILVFVCFNSYSQKFQLQDFAVSLSALVQPEEHIWVNSGFSNVSPKQNTVTGVRGFISPPFAATDFFFKLNFVVNDHLVPDAGSFGKNDCGLLYSGGTWQPDRIIRNGTYHQITEAGLISIYITSELIPLYGDAGFMLKCSIKNRDTKKISVKMVPEIKAGKPDYYPLDSWKFSPPKGTKEANRIDSTTWQNETVKICLYNDTDELIIDPHKEKVFCYAFIIYPRDKEPGKNIDYCLLEASTKKAWELRLDKYLKNIPVISSNIDGLKEYYNHSLISGLVTIWENPSFKLNPHLSTGGMDGGAICTYLWDWGGYIQHIMPLMLGKEIKKLAMAFKGVDLSKNYAYAPDGTGVGVQYSYSVYSFTSLVWNVFLTTGADFELYEEVKRLVLIDEKQRKPGEVLIDYGVQHNLLEMRGAGWEHYVASPNAERAWNLERLSDMAAMLGKNQKEQLQWRLLADSIKNSIKNELWDKDSAWFKTLYPLGHKEICYSIQGFDALNALGDKALVKNALRHIPKFMGNNGITSVAFTDKLHYEELDTDWSGGGAYTGDGPQLALFLYNYDYPIIAWDVLKRFLWMGKHMAYYPQELYYNRPQSPAHKRANIISGIAGAQTILFGIIGIRYEIDGSIYIVPQPPQSSEIQVTDLRINGKSVDIELNNGNLKVRVDKKIFYNGKTKRLKIIEKRVGEIG